MAGFDTMYRTEGGLFNRGQGQVVQARADIASDKVENKSDEYRAIASVLSDQISSVFESSGYFDTRVQKKQLETIEETLKKSNDLSTDERGALNKTLSELKTANLSLIKNEDSLRSAVVDSLKENVPTLTGIMAAIGLNNPAILFLGNMMQSLLNNTLKVSKSRQETLQKYHNERAAQQAEALRQAENAAKDEEKRAASGEKTEDEMMDLQEKGQEYLQLMYKLMNEWSDSIKKGTDFDIDSMNAQLLDSVSGMLDTAINQNVSQLSKDITAASEKDSFKAIERAREQGRADDRKIDAIEGISDKMDELIDVKKKQEKEDEESLLDKAGNLSMMAMAAVGPVKKLASTLFKVGKRFAGPIGLLLTGYEAFKGGVDGWKNAAEKLGKDTATTSDKFASAIGGGLGEIVGVADSLLGLFGIQTDIKGFVDTTVTNFLATAFDKIKEWGSDITGMFSFVTDWLKVKKEEMIAFTANVLNVSVMDIKNFFSNLFQIYFPEGFSIGDMLLVPMRTAKMWFENLFNIELPEIPSFNEMAFAAIENIKEWAAELFESLKNPFKDFSFKSLLPWNKDDIEAPKQEEIVQKPQTRGERKIIEARPKQEEVEFMASHAQPQIISKVHNNNDQNIAKTSPRTRGSVKAMRLMQQKEDERRKQNNASQANIVNAPKSSVVNSSSNTTVQHMNVSPHDNDGTLSRMMAQMGY